MPLDKWLRRFVEFYLILLLKRKKDIATSVITKCSFFFLLVWLTVFFVMHTSKSFISTKRLIGKYLRQKCIFFQTNNAKYVKNNKKKFILFDSMCVLFSAIWFCHWLWTLIECRSLVLVTNFTLDVTFVLCMNIFTLCRNTFALCNKYFRLMYTMSERWC